MSSRPTGDSQIGTLMIPALFGFNSTIWGTAIVVLIVIPLAAIWLFSLADTLRRHDLSRRARLLWLVVLVPLPIVGTLVYLYCRPGLREQARLLRERDRQRQSFAESRAMAVAILDDLAATAAIAQVALAESAELLDEVLRALSEAESTVGRPVPLTHFRPLGLVEARLGRLTVRLRPLRKSLERMSVALGVNADDIKRLARQIETLRLVGGDETVAPDAPMPVLADGDAPANTGGHAREPFPQ